MVIVRPCRSEDESAVVSLWWRSWHSIRPGLVHPHPVDAWRARWRAEIAGTHEIVVAEDEAVLVGFAAADVSARVLSQIFVAPDRKRQGIGGQLLAWARRCMPDGFTLVTLVENHASRAFYERHGLRAGGTRVNPVNDMPTVEYHWSPSAP
jgi:putative acetyltransferase